MLPAIEARAMHAASVIRRVTSGKSPHGPRTVRISEPKPNPRTLVTRRMT